MTNVKFQTELSWPQHAHVISRRGCCNSVRVSLPFSTLEPLPISVSIINQSINQSVIF